MAQKVNPIAVRLNFNRFSDSSWFSDYYYSTLLYQDLNFRQYLSSIKQPTANKLGFRSAKCIIHHFPKRSLIHLFCLSDPRKKDPFPVPQDSRKSSLHRVLVTAIPGDAAKSTPKDRVTRKARLEFTTSDVRQLGAFTTESSEQLPVGYTNPRQLDHLKTVGEVREVDLRLRQLPVAPQRGPLANRFGDPLVSPKGNFPREEKNGITDEETPIVGKNAETPRGFSSVFSTSENVSIRTLGPLGVRPYWLKSSILHKKRALVNLHRGVVESLSQVSSAPQREQHLVPLSSCLSCKDNVDLAAWYRKTRAKRSQHALRRLGCYHAAMMLAACPRVALHFLADAFINKGDGVDASKALKETTDGTLVAGGTLSFKRRAARRLTKDTLVPESLGVQSPMRDERTLGAQLSILRAILGLNRHAYLGEFHVHHGTMWPVLAQAAVGQQSVLPVGEHGLPGLSGPLSKDSNPKGRIRLKGGGGQSKRSDGTKVGGNSLKRPFTSVSTFPESWAHWLNEVFIPAGSSSDNVVLREGRGDPTIGLDARELILAKLRHGAVRTHYFNFYALHYYFMHKMGDCLSRLPLRLSRSPDLLPRPSAQGPLGVRKLPPSLLPIDNRTGGNKLALGVSWFRRSILYKNRSKASAVSARSDRMRLTALSRIQGSFTIEFLQANSFFLPAQAQAGMNAKESRQHGGCWNPTELLHKVREVDQGNPNLRRAARSEKMEPSGFLFASSSCKHITKSFDFYLSNVHSILSHNTNTFISLRPIKVHSVFQSASLVAQEVACKLEQKKSFRLICRLIFQQLALCNYIKGIRITCSGRLNGAEIAKTECRKFGETSLHVFSDKIDYARAEASTPYGILGVKVWISYI